MKKTLLVILILFFAGGIAKAKHKHHKKAQATGSSIESITMHRTACFGRCPDYMVEINSNGLVKYTGIHFTADSGAYEKNIGTADIKKVFDLFTAYRVDSCQDAYDNRIPDAPGLIYMIKYNNRTQMIHNAQFGPYFLKELSRNIDAISKVDDSWTKVTGK